jgi:hypothetical protein
LLEAHTGPSSNAVTPLTSRNARPANGILLALRRGMIVRFRLHQFLMFVPLVACGGSTSPTPDGLTLTPAEAATASCQYVGTTLCHQMYQCYSPSDIAGFGYPATEADCVIMENANCGDDPPKPGFCKGSAQTSTAMANACGFEIDGMTCDQFKQPSSGVCKTELCAQ